MTKGTDYGQTAMRFWLILTRSTLLVWLYSTGAANGEKINCTLQRDGEPNEDCIDHVERMFQNSDLSPYCKNLHYGMILNFLQENETCKVIVDINFTHPSKTEILKCLVTEETCNITQCNDSSALSFNVSTFEVKKKGPFSHDLGFNAEISMKHVKEDLYVAVSTTTWQNALELDVEETGLESYNRFHIAKEAPVVILQIEREDYHEMAPLPVDVKFTPPPAPLAYVPDDVYFIEVEQLCAYYDMSVEPNRWDHKVCDVITNGTDTTCECQHNSAFAIIFAVRSVVVDDGLKVASQVMEVISMVFLLITAVLLGVYRERLRNFDCVLVQISLCFALMLTHIFLIFSPLAVRFDKACLALATITHCFLVSTAVLMVMEGVLMLTKVLEPNFFTCSPSTKKRRRIRGFLIAWVLPMVYAGLCAAIGISMDGNAYAQWSVEKGRHQACWINPKYFPVVIVPVILALAINTGIVLRFGVLVWKMSKSAENFKPTDQRNAGTASHALKGLRAVAILMPILGVPWIIGFLVSIEGAEIVFMSLHLVINGLQGLLVFLHYVVFNSQMRSCMKRSWKTATSNFWTSTPAVHSMSKKQGHSAEMEEM